MDQFWGGQQDRGDSDGYFDNWPVCICLLGDFRLVQWGKTAPWCGEKMASLLGNLAIEPNYRLSRDILLHRLWPDHSHTRARQALNSLVHSFRKNVEVGLGLNTVGIHTVRGTNSAGIQAIKYEDGYFQLNPEAGIAVDVTAFRNIVKRADREWSAGHYSTATSLYEQAKRIYKGDLATVASAGDAALLREQLRSHHITSLMRLAQHYYMQGEYSTAVEIVREVLAKEACQEDAHRLIMRCHVLSGERSQALHQYHLCQQALRQEFDAVPEEATTELFNVIRLNPSSIALDALVGPSLRLDC